MIRVRVSLPLPDHHPAQAFDELIGFGLVDNVSPHLGKFDFELEADNLVKLMQTVYEVADIVRTYDWWIRGSGIIEKFEDALGQLKLTSVTLSSKDVERLRKHLDPSLKYSITYAIRDRIIGALKEATPLGESKT